MNFYKKMIIIVFWWQHKILIIFKKFIWGLFYRHWTLLFYLCINIFVYGLINKFACYVYIKSIIWFFSNAICVCWVCHSIRLLQYTWRIPWAGVHSSCDTVYFNNGNFWFRFNIFIGLRPPVFHQNIFS